jgi:hypothetical protein
LPDRATHQAADFAGRMRGTDRGEAGYRNQIDWWKKHLARPRRWLPWRAPPSGLDRIIRRPRRVPASNIESGIVRVPVPPALMESLNQLRRDQRTTLYVIWLAAIAMLVCRENGESELPVGTYVTTRRGLAMKDVIGFWTNLVVVKVTCDFTASGSAWLKRIEQELTEMRARSLVPYDDIRHELADGRRMVPVRVIVDTPLGYGREDAIFAGITIRWADIPPSQSVPGVPTISLDRTDDRQTLRFEFDPHRYDPAKVRAFIDRLMKILTALPGQIDRPAGELLDRALR